MLFKWLHFSSIHFSDTQCTLNYDFGQKIGDFYRISVVCFAHQTLSFGLFQNIYLEVGHPWPKATPWTSKGP